MASKETNALYLPLKIDLDAWEASLLAADADLRKAMRELKSEASRVRMEWDVKIAGAEAAGNQVEKLRLQQAKLNQMLAIQKKEVEALTKAYQKEVQASGASSKASQDLAKALQKETMQMHRLQIQVNQMNAGFGTKLADGLSKVSPEFAALRANFAAVTSEISSLSSAAGVSAAAIGGVAAAAGALYLAYQAAGKIKDEIVEMGNAAAQASEPVFELAERMGLAYEESAKLSGVFAIDGTNYDAYVKALQKFNKQLNGSGEAAKEAKEFLKQYGVELQDAAGRQLSIEQQTMNLARAFNSIASEGEKLDFLVKVLGTAGTQYAHLFKGMDDYVAKQKEIAQLSKIDYERAHEILTRNNQLAEGYKNLAQAKGQAWVESTLAIQEQEIKNLQAMQKQVYDNAQTWKEFGDVVGKIGVKYTASEGLLGSAWEQLKTSGAEMVVGIHDWFTDTDRAALRLEQVQNEIAENNKKAAEEKEKQRQAELQAEKRKNDQEAKEAADKEKKIAEVRKQWQKEIDSIGKSSLQKELDRIEERKKAAIDAGMSVAEAEELFQKQKADIVAKYDNQEIEKNRQKWEQQAQAAKNAQEQINSVFMTATQKRIAEIEKQKQAWIRAGADEVEATKAAQKQIHDAQVSEAERTLREQAELIKRARAEQAAGGDWQERVKQWSNNQYMQKLGLNQGDLSWAKQAGLEFVKELGNARERILGPLFGGGSEAGNTTNNNTVNVNFDNTVVADDAGIMKFANRVAEVIMPVVMQAIGDTGNSSNSYNAAG